MPDASCAGVLRRKCQEFVDFVVASTISEMERDATGKTAQAFYEFWNTGDEARPKTRPSWRETFCQLRRTARRAYKRRQRLVCGPAEATGRRKRNSR